MTLDVAMPTTPNLATARAPSFFRLGGRTSEVAALRAVGLYFNNNWSKSSDNPEGETHRKKLRNMFVLGLVFEQLQVTCSKTQSGTYLFT